MTAPQAQSKLNEVYDYLTSFEGMINPNNIRFSRWLIDAQALRQSSPAEGFLMEALVYRLQGKLDMAVEYAEKSYRIDKTVACNDYATLLSNAGKFKEAVNLASINLKEDNFSAHALNRLIIDSFLTFDRNALSKGLSLFKNSNNESQELISLGSEKLNSINDKVSIFEQTGVTIDNFISVYSLAARAMNSYYLGDTQISINTQYNEVGTFLIIDEELSNVDIDDCFLIHDKYTDDLIDSDLSFKDYKRIVYNFLPLTEDNYSEVSVLKAKGIIA